jgi:thioester reductase-like protein
VPTQKKRYWIDPNVPVSQASTGSDIGSGTHPFLGWHTQMATDENTHIWETDLNLARRAYLDDHRVLDFPVFPATGYLELVRAAAMETWDTSHVKVVDVLFQKAMVINRSGTLRIQAVFKPAEPNSGQVSFEVYSRSNQEKSKNWTRHVTGRVTFEAPLLQTRCLDLDDIKSRCSHSFSVQDHYQAYRKRSINYGGAFQGVKDIWRRDGEALGFVELPPMILGQADTYSFHPALLDACLQLMGTALPEEGDHKDQTFMPVELEALTVAKTGMTCAWSHAKIRDDQNDPDSFVADINICDAAGNIWCTASGLKVGRLEKTEKNAIASRDLFYQIEWRKMAMDALPESSDVEFTDHLWVVFSHNSSWEKTYIERIRSLNQKLIVVDINDDTRHPDPGYHHLNALDEVQLNTFFSQFKNNTDQVLTRVLFLGEGSEMEMDTMSADCMLRFQENNCAAMLCLAKTLAAIDLSRSPLLWVITMNAQGGDNHPVSCHQSPMWGLGRVLLHEFAETWGGIVDLDGLNLTDMDRSVAVINESGREDQIRIRDNHFFAARLCPRVRPSDQNRFTCDPLGSYLITGGLGALGLMIADWLFKCGARHIILTGRSSFSKEDKWRRLKDAGDKRIASILNLQQMGATIHVLQADVSDETDMTRVFDMFGKTLPELKGIIHAAGVAVPKPAAELTPLDLFDTLQAKVKGTWILHQMSRKMDLSFFIMFSSASAIWGSKLLAHYAAANHFMDALAHHRHSQGLVATAINWGMWGGGGMSSDESNKAQLEKIGMKEMDPLMALDSLGHLILEKRPQCTVADVDWNVLKPLYELQPRRMLLEEISIQKQNIPSKKADQSDQEENKALFESLSEAENDSARSLVIEDFIAQKASKVIGIPPDKLDRNASLSDSGLDSLVAAELKGTLEQSLKIKVNVLSLLRSENLGQIAIQLLDGIKDRVDPIQTQKKSSIVDMSDGRMERQPASCPEEESLDRGITPPGNRVGLAKKPEHIFITGTTGYLGAFMLAHLCEQTDAVLYCLVRSTTKEEGLDRIISILKGYKIWSPEFVSRIEPVPGDLSTPGFGLDDDSWKRLSDRIDKIFHVGFHVNFLFSYQDMRATNVVGAIEILKLATHSRLKPVHFVSSFSVFFTPEYIGRDVFEADPLFPGHGAYRENKRACEFLIDEARKRGVPVNIYRPPFISWPVDTGVPNDRDFLIRLIKGCIQLGKAPDIDLLFHLAPVEYVSRAILSISDNPEAIGKNFNIIGDPYGTLWPDLIKWMNQAGAKIDMIEYREWRDFLDKAGKNNPLHIFFPMFSDDLPERGSAVMELFNAGSMPSRFDATGSLDVLGGRLICPEVNTEFVRALIDNLANS